ncbi:MAG: hypothetical protein J6T10_21225 [Methanobrevibacter sp.]|nr:hypothetical protein [Methanobrevibacter sp.]
MGIFGLKDALGGTLRQCLCVKESLNFDNTDFVDLGTINWTYYNGVFSGNITGKASSTNKLLCTKYKTNNAGYSGSYPSDNNCIWSSLDTATQVFIKDTSYTDATAFKNAMKGVLLAYEKA